MSGSPPPSPTSPLPDETPYPAWRWPLFTGLGAGALTWLFQPAPAAAAWVPWAAIALGVIVATASVRFGDYDYVAFVRLCVIVIVWSWFLEPGGLWHGLVFGALVASGLAIVGAGIDGTLEQHHLLDAHRARHAREESRPGPDHTGP